MVDVNDLDYFDHELMALLYGNPPDYDNLARWLEKNPEPVPEPAQGEQE